MSQERRIVRAEATRCRVPMPHPVRIGRIVYETRDYVVLRITRDDGATGRAIGYTRDTPLLEALRTVCAASEGMDVQDPAAFQAALHRRYLPGWPALVRGASLLDIALWDAASRARGLPLHRLLGAERDDAPFMAVAGYFPDIRSEEELVAEALGFVADGAMTIKLILSGIDAARDRSLADAMADALPAEVPIAIDFHAHWEAVAPARDHCATLADLRPRFIEDPFLGSEWRLYEQLAASSPIPLAAGEDAIGLSAYRDVLPHIGFLRADATASGGISTALEAIDAATRAGVEVVPHVFPYVHAVLCAARGAVTNAEVIPAGVGADPMHLLLREPYPIRDGRWHLGSAPGLHLPLDDEAVARYADGSFSISRSA